LPDPAPELDDKALDLSTDSAILEPSLTFGQLHDDERVKALGIQLTT
jgi:hypothetical protein